MSRIANIFDTTSTTSRGYVAQNTDLRYGAQMGFSNELSTWVSNHPHVARNVVLFLLEAPLFMKKLPDAEYQIASLRQFFETMPHTVNGLTNTINVETDSIPFGRDGSVQEFFTNVKYSPINLSLTMHERYNRGVWRMLHSWIRLGMMDPQMGFAAANTIQGVELDDGLPDQWTATLLAVECDHNHREPVQSWIITNVAPKDSIENIASRNMTNQGYQKQDLQIALTGIPQRGPGPEHLGKKLMARMPLTNADPHLRNAYINEIDPAVAARPFGYAHGISQLAQDQVNI